MYVCQQLSYIYIYVCVCVCVCVCVRFMRSPLLLIIVAIMAEKFCDRHRVGFCGCKFCGPCSVESFCGHGGEDCVVRTVVKVLRSSWRGCDYRACCRF